MRNKVEILRAIQYTIIDLESISNLDEIAEFTDKDKEFMEAFKKIYEFGLKQLEFFIKKLDEEGKDLDVYSIQYYVNVLLNGPLGNFARELSKDKLYFVNTPDAMGALGNKLKSLQNTTVLNNSKNQLGCSVDLYNKMPQFLQLELQKSVDESEKMFKSSLRSSTEVDNTKPIVDKRNQQRHNEEPTGQWVTRPNGNYLVKDSYYYAVLDEISNDVFVLVKEYLGDENYRLYKDKKTYNSFDDENDSTAKHYQLEKTLSDGVTTSDIKIDITGNTIDSIDRRDNVIKVEDDSDVREFVVSTNEGILGH
jgi:hypothetical protein